MLFRSNSSFRFAVAWSYFFFAATTSASAFSIFSSNASVNSIFIDIVHPLIFECPFISQDQYIHKGRHPFHHDNKTIPTFIHSFDACIIRAGSIEPAHTSLINFFSVLFVSNLNLKTTILFTFHPRFCAKHEFCRVFNQDCERASRVSQLPDLSLKSEEIDIN